MEFYVAVRTRCFINPEWLDKKISCVDKDYSYGGGIYGPFVTIAEADEQYEKVLDWVDDDDYGIYAHDDKNRWWLIRSYKNGYCSCRRLDCQSEWYEFPKDTISLAIQLAP